MIQHLLVAYDGSSQAHAALTEAVALARTTNARVTVMSVTPDLSNWIVAGMCDVAVSTDELRRQSERAYERILDAARDVVPDDVPFTRILTRGAPGPAIVGEANAGGNDLIVMGSPGHGGLQSLLPGSTSRYVLRKSPVPVLVAHAACSTMDRRRVHPGGPSPTRIEDHDG